MPKLIEYSVHRVHAYFGVIDLLEHAESNGSLVIDPISPLGRTVRGTDGAVTWVAADYLDCEMTVKIAAQSSTHVSLLQAAIGDALTGSGAQPLSFIDRHTGISYVCPTAKIIDWPKVAISDNAAFLPWRFAMPGTVIAATGGSSTGLVTPITPS